MWGMRLYPLLIWIAVLLFAEPARAVEAEHLSRAALAGQADVVVIGRITGLKSAVIHGQVWTVATISPERSLKGRPAATLRVQIPGGEQVIGGRTLVTRIEGAPVLNVNQKGLFFLNHGDSDVHHLTGVNQGYWRIETVSGKEVVTSVSGSAEPIPLDSVLTEISRGLKEGVQR